jgi:hypothetical protein
VPQESIEAPDQVRRAMMQGRTLGGGVSGDGLVDDVLGLEGLPTRDFVSWRSIGVHRPIR